MSEADQMSGVFRKWQREYAKRGIPTFPVNDNKKPATRAYSKVGRKGSADLAEKFTEASALGLMLGPRSGLTVLDIDTCDESILADALRRHGDSRLKVQSAGGFHVYYAHRGEGRFIRPDPEKPIDILGNGFIVAPPSRVAKGEYRIIEGTLDDLKSLPPLHSVLDSLRRGPIPHGLRNNTVFRRLLRQVRYCDDFDTLLDVARTLNMDCIPPMEDARLLNTAKKVWEYETTGNLTCPGSHHPASHASSHRASHHPGTTSATRNEKLAHTAHPHPVGKILVMHSRFAGFGLGTANAHYLRDAIRGACAAKRPAPHYRPGNLDRSLQPHR